MINGHAIQTHTMTKRRITNKIILNPKIDSLAGEMSILCLFQLQSSNQVWIQKKLYTLIHLFYLKDSQHLCTTF